MTTRRNGHSPKAQALPVKVRASRGVPKFVYGLMLLAVAIVFMQGTFVELSANFGRVWPSGDSAKVNLDKTPYRP